MSQVLGRAQEPNSSQTASCCGPRNRSGSFNAGKVELLDNKRMAGEQVALSRASRYRGHATDPVEMLRQFCCEVKARDREIGLGGDNRSLGL
jgi:hypothetical protein